MKAGFFIVWFIALCLQTVAQPATCTFPKPQITIHFGSGDVRDLNSGALYNYDRVLSSCPTDGHYTYTSYTSECFRGDWFTLDDHTPGDADGNMLLVNSSYSTGTFFITSVNGLKGGMIYQFGFWIMNVCRITDKCPFPLLPNLVIRLQTTSGKVVAQFATGEVPRVPSPKWTQHRAVFTMPAGETSLVINMINNQPGGCGNDFAMDDITFAECVKQKPVVTASKAPAVKTTPAKKPSPPPAKPVVKKPATAPVAAVPRDVKVGTPKKDTQTVGPPVVKAEPRRFPPPPPALTSRTNDVFKRIETEPGQIKVNLYDNGEIDGDTISIYHNNVRIMAHARLSAKPISLSIPIDPSNPHHELVMVAENLGSIPPNTSLMIITAGTKRYEVFISSTTQRNAKVVFDLKE